MYFLSYICEHRIQNVREEREKKVMVMMRETRYGRIMRGRSPDKLKKKSTQQKGKRIRQETKRVGGNRGVFSQKLITSSTTNRG